MKAARLETHWQLTGITRQTRTQRTHTHTHIIYTREKMRAHSFERRSRARQLHVPLRPSRRAARNDRGLRRECAIVPVALRRHRLLNESIRTNLCSDRSRIREINARNKCAIHPSIHPPRGPQRHYRRCRPGSATCPRESKFDRSIDSFNGANFKFAK